VFRAFLKGWPTFGADHIISDLESIGDYLMNHPEPPWLRGVMGDWDDSVDAEYCAKEATKTVRFSQAGYVGAVAILAILMEQSIIRHPDETFNRHRLGPLSDFYPYLIRRNNPGSKRGLPNLPVPALFRNMLISWAEREVNFTGVPT
jgi:hypothetical protein